MRLIIIPITFLLFAAACKQNNGKNQENGTKDTTIDLNLTDGSQTKEDTNKSSDEVVLDIREEFKRINAASLTKKVYEFACKNDPGEGTATYFTNNGHVVKVAVDWGVIGDYAYTSEYYYQNDRLIFIYEIIIGGPANGPDTKTEERTYINNDKTIKYMENEKVSTCKTCDFNTSSKEYRVLKAYNMDSNTVTAALCEEK